MDDEIKKLRDITERQKQELKRYKKKLAQVEIKTTQLGKRSINYIFPSII